MALYHLWFCWFSLMKNEILQSLNPKDRERESHPCVNLHREKLLQLPLNCVKLRFFSCTSDLLARTYDFRICTTVHRMLILSRLNLGQNQNLELILSALLCCVSHITTLPVFTCVMNARDQTRQTFVTGIKYRVYQYEPRKDISEQVVSKLLTILQLIQFLLLLIGGHPTSRQDFENC